MSEEILVETESEEEVKTTAQMIQELREFIGEVKYSDMPDGAKKECMNLLYEKIISLEKQEDGKEEKEK